MNKLAIGLGDKTEALFPDKPGFLVIDDGPICDAFLKKYKRAKEWNPFDDSFNPLKKMTVRKARDLTSVFYGSEGQQTLTVRNGRVALTRMLFASKNLNDLPDDLYDKKDDKVMYEAMKEAQQRIDDVLFSPVLRKVLCNPAPRWMFSGSLVARINRAELGDFDSFILASLLIAEFPGQIILPDGGFYLRPFHAALIREERLIIGLNTLSELDEKMRQMCLLQEKIGRQTTFEDAETLAKYAGLVPTTNEYKEFVAFSMSGEK